MRAWNKKRKPKHAANSRVVNLLGFRIIIPSFNLKQSYYDDLIKANLIITKYHKNSYHI